jgi:hypothetical protein
LLQGVHHHAPAGTFELRRISNFLFALRQERCIIILIDQRSRKHDFGYSFSSIVGCSVSIFWRPLLRPAVSLPLAWLSIALFAPSRAGAGCDYPTHVERTLVDPMSLSTRLSAAPKSDTRLPDKPCSCTGPTCSRQPLAPLVPPSVESTNMSQWGKLLPPLIVTPLQQDTWIPEDSFSLPARHPSLVYHPPRLAL